MRTRTLVFLIAAAQTLSAAAEPLPPTIASAGVTQAEWNAIQEEARVQARLRSYSDQVVAQLAIDVLRAQPGQPVAVYLDILRNSVGLLAQAQASFRELNPGGNADLVELREETARAADEGRLQDALVLQDRYVSTLESSSEATEATKLELAAAIAASGEAALLIGDYLGAAERFRRAADTVPASSPYVRWQYLDKQSFALYRFGTLGVMRGVSPDYAIIDQALRVLIDDMWPLVSRDVSWQNQQTRESVFRICDVLPASGGCGSELE
jgi:hypothetical protein